MVNRKKVTSHGCETQLIGGVSVLASAAKKVGACEEWIARVKHAVRI